MFEIPAYATPPLASLPLFAVLGLAAGLLGRAFNRGLLKTLELFGRVPPSFAILAAALVGSAVGLIGYHLPHVPGNGHALAEAVLRGGFSLPSLVGLFALRFALTMASYGKGVPGGIFAPLLVLGALLGRTHEECFRIVFPAAVPTAEAFAVVGMAAYLSAIVRAPLTGIMLIVEMTGNYDQKLPLLVSCFCAYVVMEFFQDLPIYEALLERDLRLDAPARAPENPIVEFVVEPNEPFVGQQVRNLGLPTGCILVRCVDGKHEWVPRADTRLAAGMRLTAFIAPEAYGGLEILRQGCGSSAARTLKREAENTGLTASAARSE
ncbi:MAG: chloride channel protein [Candidatus Binatia bacterium]|nr:chloride channel protein [Candidatus Binatia bacterium]